MKNRYVAATVFASFLMAVGATAEERMRAIDLKLPGPDGDLVDGAPIYERAMSEGRPALIEAYDEVFAKDQLDALLFPTVPQVAVEASPEASSLEVFTRFIRNADPGSVAGLPGQSVAAGLGPDTGLPVGIELDGAAGSDRRLIALGMAIEALLGHTAPPDMR